MHITKNEHGFYEARIKGPDGKVKSFSTHKKSRQAAKEVISEAKIAELERAAELGVLTPAVISVLVAGKRIKVEDAIGPWKEWMTTQRYSPNYIANSEMWFRSWAMASNVLRKPLMTVTEKHLDPWINAPGDRKMSTRVVMLAALRSFFQFASAKGWCMGNPAVLVSVDPFLLLHNQKEVYRQPCFNDEEVKALLALTGEEGRKPSEFWHAAVAISRYTGLRLSDVASLEWSCLSPPGKISVWTRKRDRRVELPLEPEALRNALLNLPRLDRMFMFPHERDIIRDPKRRALLSAQFSKLCRLCGIEGKSFHGLRSTYVSECYANGVPMEHIAERVGHRYAATTAGYVRENE